MSLQLIVLTVFGILALLPGADNAQVLTRASATGARSALWLAAGTALGKAAIAWAGFVTVSAASTDNYQRAGSVLGFASLGYLAGAGAYMWIRAKYALAPPDPTPDFGKGVALGSTNPFTLVLCTIVAGGSSLSRAPVSEQIMYLPAMLAGAGLALALYILAGSLLHRLDNPERTARIASRVMGGLILATLVLVGWILATSTSRH